LTARAAAFGVLNPASGWFTRATIPANRFAALISSSSALSPTWQPVDQPSGQLVLGADAQGGQWTVDYQTGEVWRERAGNVTAFGKVFTGLPGFDCNDSYHWYFDSRLWLWVHDGVDLFRYTDYPGLFV
jgi:hypothetical protein